MQKNEKIDVKSRFLEVPISRRHKIMKSSPENDFS